MWLLVGNICANPKMKQAFVDGDLLDAKASGADLLSFNEIWVDRYKDAVRRVFKGFKIRFLNHTANPMVLKDTYGSFLYTNTIKLHKGYRLTTPCRELNEAKVLIGHLGVPVVFMNTHWVSGAWNKKPKFRKKLRKKLWCESYEKTRERVEYWQHNGYYVILQGDLNKIDVAPFNRNCKFVIDGGIVKVMIAEPAYNKTNITIKVKERDAITDVNTDKPLHLLKLDIRKKH